MSLVAKALAIAKIPAMLRMVEDFEEQEEPLVVFSAHRAPIDELEKRKGWGVITGDTSPEERSRLEARFQAGDLLGIGCTIRAGGVSITLTRACNALFVDREWTPALNSQAEDRTYRIGQDRPVLITTLVADHPLDLRVTELTTDKQVLIDASVDAARMQDEQGTKEGSQEEAREAS
jgi:SNF2 family DNA or RNA helicase